MLNITTNVSSLRAQRVLMRNTQALNTSFQRLSTGLRINSAKDDSAGLTIANKMSAQIRGLNQAVRNATDGQSMARTAEAALNEQQDMLQRLRELAVQASSDTYTAQDRQAIQQEADALVSEIDRIATQTAFNERKLLDGSLSDVKLQVGAFESETVDVTIAGARAFNLGSVYSQTTSTVSTGAVTSGTITLNGFSVRATTANDDTVSSASNSASAIAKARVINEGTVDHGISATVNSNVITGGALTAGAVAAGTYSVNGVSIGAFTVADASDSDYAFRNAINAVSAATGVVASLDSSNNVVLTATDGRNVVTSGGAAFGVADGTYTSTIELKSEDQMVVGGSGVAAIGLGATTYTTKRATNVSNLDFATQAGATTAIDVIDDSIRAVSGRQSELGALLNRLDAAVAQLGAASENLEAARGQIRDADFAAETAVFSKNQILQQASSAMLAQANVADQIALTLLG